MGGNLEQFEAVRFGEGEGLIVKVGSRKGLEAEAKQATEKLVLLLISPEFVLNRDHEGDQFLVDIVANLAALGGLRIRITPVRSLRPVVVHPHHCLLCHSIPHIVPPR